MSDQTKYALLEALKKQLTKKPFRKVTISDLTDECGINRMTFYYHFHDIYDLLVWSLQKEAEQLQKEGAFDTWQEALLAIFNSLLENKSYITNIYHSVGRDPLERYLSRALDDTFFPLVKAHVAEGNVSIGEEELRFVLRFYEYAFIGVLQDWIEHDMQPSSESMMDRLSRIMDGSIEESLQRFSNPADA